MHLRLIAVGKIRERYIASAIDDFRARLAPYHRIEEREVRAEAGSDPARAMDAEAAAILRHVEPGETLWLLERTGTELTSEDVAQRLDALAVGGISRLTLAIAGTYGAGAALVQRADFLWSLSRLTLLHEWARALVYEQLYRATKIARGEPYHH